MLTFSELAEQLGLTRPALSALVRDGLPYTADKRRKLFDGDEVAAWLVANGHAERSPPAPTVAVTREEAAQLLGVHLRTLAGWLRHGDFPGRAGDRGARNGYFPIEEIEAWRARTIGGPASDEDPSGEPTARERLASANDQTSINQPNSSGASPT